MNAYSSDLRERVIAAARNTNLTQPEIAKTFSVSLSSVEDWLHTYRTTGRIKPLPFARGAKRMLQPHAQVIRELVAQQPDVTLGELCQRVAAKTGVSANPSMMCRELQILKLPRKKVTARQPTRN
jgi:transposase